MLVMVVNGYSVNRTGEEIEEVWLPPKSVYILTGDARYKWTHGIEFKKFDIFNGEKINRKMRISITFRTIHEKFLSKIVKNSMHNSF